MKPTMSANRMLRNGREKREEEKDLNLKCSLSSSDSPGSKNTETYNAGATEYPEVNGLMKIKCEASGSRGTVIQSLMSKSAFLFLNDH